MTASVAVSDGTMPCPVPSPTGLPCRKHIPNGWTADEGHGGGHWWMSDRVATLLDSGHYDAAAVLAGLPFSEHAPEDCIPSCPRYWDERTTANCDDRQTENRSG